MLLIWFSVIFEAWSQEAVSAPDTSITEAALLLSEYVQYASVTGNERDAGIYMSEVFMLRYLQTVLTVLISPHPFILLACKSPT